LLGCEVDFSSGVVSTNCVFDAETGSGSFCHRLGGSGERVLACLELEKVNVEMLGEACDAIENWCGAESICVNKQCVSLCNIKDLNVCDDLDACCALWLGGGQEEIGYCAEICL